MLQNHPAEPLQFLWVLSVPRIICWGIGLTGLVFFVESWGRLGG